MTRLTIDLPDYGVTAGAVLYHHAAPTITRAIIEAIGDGYESTTSHACFDGHQVFCFLPGSGELPLENRTMRPRPGDIMSFYAGGHDFAFLSENRLTGGAEAVYEIAFCYGEVDLRHYWEEGMHGSLVGRVDDNLGAFAAACSRTLNEGRTRLRLRHAQ